MKNASEIMATKQTHQLRANVEDQLDRLVKQLADLESYRDELGAEEYTETKQETLEQMREFQASLTKLSAGDLSLTDYLASIQLAIQATLSQVFRTPEVIQLFAKRQPERLRESLSAVTRDLKSGRLAATEARAKRLEILGALKGLGEVLTPEESGLVDESVPLQQFIAISQSSSEINSKLLALAETCLGTVNK